MCHFFIYIRNSADIWRYWINCSVHQKCFNLSRFGWEGWLACICSRILYTVWMPIILCVLIMQTILFIIKLLVITNTRGIVRKILGPSVCTQSFDNLSLKIRNEYSYCMDHDLVLVPLRSAMQWCLMVSTIIAKINAVCMWTSGPELIWFCACSRLCTSGRKSYTCMHHFSKMMMKQAIVPSKYCKLHGLPISLPYYHSDHYNLQGKPRFTMDTESHLFKMGNSHLQSYILIKIAWFPSHENPL